MATNRPKFYKAVRASVISRHLNDDGIPVCAHCQKIFEADHVITLHHTQPWRDVRDEVMKAPEFWQDSTHETQQRLLKLAFNDYFYSGEALVPLHNSCHAEIDNGVTYKNQAERDRFDKREKKLQTVEKQQPEGKTPVYRLTFVSAPVSPTPVEKSAKSTNQTSKPAPVVYDIEYAPPDRPRSATSEIQWITKEKNWLEKLIGEKIAVLPNTLEEFEPMLKKAQDHTGAGKLSFDQRANLKYDMLDRFERWRDKSLALRSGSGWER